MTELPDNLSFLMNQANFLILEDLLSFRSQLIADLRLLKYSGPIYEAENVNTAYNLLTSIKIDFIISDWNLPDGTGYDFLIEVKKMPQYQKTPFIMWTTKNEVQNIISAISAGASEYFNKPWAKEELNTKILKSWEKVYGKQKK